MLVSACAECLRLLGSFTHSVTYTYSFILLSIHLLTIHASVTQYSSLPSSVPPTHPPFGPRGCQNWGPGSKEPSLPPVNWVWGWWLVICLGPEYLDSVRTG